YVAYTTQDLIRVERRRGHASRLGQEPRTAGSMAHLLVGTDQLLVAGHEQVQDLLLPGGDGESFAEEGDVHRTTPARAAPDLPRGENLPHALEQVLVAVRLGDVVVSAALQSAHYVHGVGEPREQHHREPG